jgi:hypothetical protein
LLAESPPGSPTPATLPPEGHTETPLPTATLVVAAPLFANASKAGSQEPTATEPGPSSSEPTDTVATSVASPSTQTKHTVTPHTISTPAPRGVRRVVLRYRPLGILTEENIINAYYDFRKLSEQSSYVRWWHREGRHSHAIIDVYNGWEGDVRVAHMHTLPHYVYRVKVVPGMNDM